MIFINVTLFYEVQVYLVICIFEKHQKRLMPIPGADLTNNLHAAFMHADPKSAKNTVKPSVFFALLGSARIKAARKMLLKSTPVKFHHNPI